MIKNKFQTICALLAFMLIISVIGWSIYCIINNINSVPNKPTFLIINLLVIVTALFGLIYIAIDCKNKPSDLLLKIFICLQGVSHLISILRTCLTGSSMITPVFHALIFGLLCILLYMKDLSKKRAYIMCFLVFAFDITAVLIANLNNFALPRLINTSSSTIIDIILIMLIGNKTFASKK